MPENSSIVTGAKSSLPESVYCRTMAGGLLENVDLSRDISNSYSSHSSWTIT
jgi:hypothetical protein